MSKLEKSSNDIGGNAIVYTYPSGDFDLVVNPSGWYTPPGWESPFSSREDGAAAQAAPRKAGVKSQGEDMLRSMRRARAKLRRLALSNEFTHFVTLTLDQTKIDRYDGAAVTRALSRWLDNMVRRHGLKYILVPERHKDGAFHFHGFFAGDSLNLVDSGKLWNGRPVYNLPQWTLGFTTAQELYGEYSAAVGYCCKYIGKQDGERPLGRWYYSGGRLAEPLKEYAVLDYRETRTAFEGEAVEVSIPGTQLLVVHHRHDNNI